MKLVSASLDCTVKIWDLESNSLGEEDYMDLVEDQKHPSSFLLSQDSSEYVISAIDKFGYVKTFDIRL
jgi:hypothetical protein